MAIYLCQVVRTFRASLKKNLVIIYLCRACGFSETLTGNVRPESAL